MVALSLNATKMSMILIQLIKKAHFMPKIYGVLSICLNLNGKILQKNWLMIPKLEKKN